MKNKIFDKRIIAVYVFVISFFVFGITYALGVISSTVSLSSTTGQYGIDETVYGATKFSSDTLNLTPILDNEITTKTNNVIKIDFKVRGSANNPTDKKIIYDIALNDLDVDCQLLSKDVKWKLVKNDDDLSSGSLANSFDTIVDGRMVLTTIQEDLPSFTSTPDSYSFYLWVSDACQKSDISQCTTADEQRDQNYLLQKAISGKIEVELNTGEKKELTRNTSSDVNPNTCSNSQYRVVFDANGGTVSPQFVNKTSGLVTTALPTPVRSNYTFDGWYTDEDLTNKVTNTVLQGTTTNTVLYAKWTSISKTLTLVNNCTYPSNGNRTLTVNYNSTYSELVPDLCLGNKFNGWFTTASGGNQINKSDRVKLTENTSYYGQWSLNSYTLTYNLNGSTVSTANPSNYNIDTTTFNLNNPTKTGYTFTGWTEAIQSDIWYDGFIKKAAQTDNSAIGIVQNSATYPKSVFSDLIYLKANNTYTLTPNTLGSVRWRVFKNVDGVLKYYGNGSSSKTYTPTEDCYVSIMFHLGENATNRNAAKVTSSDKPTTLTIPKGSTGNRVYTANFSNNTYTISYTLNGGIAGTNAPISGTYDTDVEISSPTKTVTVTVNENSTGATVGSATSSSEQTFSGWTTNTSAGLGSNAKIGTTKPPTTSWTGTSTKNTFFRNLRDTSGTVTLTANWTAVGITLPTVGKTGYTCGWNTKADGSGTSYTSGGNYTPSKTSAASVTLYAQCSADTYTIAYNLNGGTAGTNAPTSGTYNANVQISNPTRSGYTFLGWTSSTTAGLGSNAKSGTTATPTTAWTGTSTKNTYFRNLRDTSGTVTLTANWSDSEVPVASISTTSNLKVAEQTATLACTDNVGVVSYYWGTSAPTTSSTYTTVTSTTSMSVTKTISAAGTYYLACKDVAGNVSSNATKVYYNYTVNNMLLTTTGTSTTYTTNNYEQISTNTYIAPKGTSLTLASIYTIPTGSRSGRFQGISTGVASATPVTVNKTVPTLNDNTTYSMWFSRNLIYFKFKSTDGTLTETTTSSAGTVYTWAHDGDDYITRSVSGGTASATFFSIRYGATSLNLPNYNNPAYLNITREGYSAVNGAQWICESGCVTAGKTFSHAEITISTNDICDASSDDCTVGLKVNWGGNTYKATFYYYNGTAIASTTASCTVANEAGTCNVTIPTAVTGSTGQYSNDYVGLNPSANSMSTPVASSATTITLSGNKTYYSVYRSEVSIYSPTSTTVASKITTYRNSYFTSTTEMSNKLATSTTGTTDITSVSVPTGYTLTGFATSVNTATVASGLTTVENIITNSGTTYYAIGSKSVEATFYYNSNTTSGSLTVSTTTASGTQKVYCTSVSAAGLNQGSITVPTSVSGSIGKYNTKYKGVATALSSLTSASVTTANTTYYAFYSNSVTIYYPTATNTLTSATKYRNEYFTSVTSGSEAMTSRLANANNTTTQLTQSNMTSIYGTLYRFNGTVNDMTTANMLTTTNAGESSIKTFYLTTYESITPTFYYYDGSAKASVQGTAANKYYYCASTSAVAIKNSNFTVPDEVKTNRTVSSVAWNYRGVSGSSSTTVLAGNATTATATTAYTYWYASYSTTITITYNVNGGSSTTPSSGTGTAYMNSAGTKINPSITVAAAVSYSGYSFVGWNTNSSGTGTNYKASTAYTFSSSRTLYANWARYAIYEDTDGTTTILSSYENTLSDAVDDVVALGGGTIKALVNTTESSSVTISKTNSTSDDSEDTSTTSDELNLIILPNGKQINMGTNTIDIYGNVDVSITGTGTITGTNVDDASRGVLCVKGSATLNLDGVTISNTATADTVVNSIALLVQGANLNVVSGNITGAKVALGLFGGDITIHDGTIKGNSYGVYFGANYVADETILNILGGTILTGLHTDGDYTNSYGIYLPESTSAHSTINIGSSEWVNCTSTSGCTSTSTSTSTPVIYGYNNAIYSPNTGAVININKGKLESYKYSTISNYGTVNLGDTSIKGADSSLDADIHIASQNSYAISNYASATLKYYPGTYSYSKSTSGTISNLGEIELAGGRIYGIPSTGSGFNNNGTINIYGTWKPHPGTYTYGSDSSYTYSDGVYVTVSGMTSYSSYSDGTTFSASNNNISAISSPKTGSPNSKGFKLSLDFSAPASTTGSTTLTITPKLYVGYSTYTGNCYGTVKISCSNGSTATYTGKYDFRNYVGSTLFINSGATSCSTVKSLITSSSSSAGKVTMNVKRGDSISCSATFTGGSKVGGTATVSGSITVK